MNVSAVVASAGALRRAAQTVAALDPDWAQRRNGSGFSAADAPFGHALAGLPEERWTPKVARDAWEMLRSYWAQLEEAGVDFDELPVPPDYPDKHVTVDSARGPRQTTCGRAHVLAFGRQHRSGHIALIVIEGATALVDSAQDPQIIAAVKPLGQWDGQRRFWRVELSSPAKAQALIDLADRFAMTVPDGFAAAVRAISGAVSGGTPPGVHLVGDRSVLVVPSGDPAEWAELEDIDAATLDRNRGGFVVSLSPALWVIVADIAARYGLPVDQAATDHVVAEFAEALAAYQRAVALEPRGTVTEIPGMVDLPGQRFDATQFAAVEYAVDQDPSGGIFVFDEQGIGKTAIAMAAAAVLCRRRILVVCPGGQVKPKWRAELAGRFPEWDVQMIDGRGDAGAAKVVGGLDPGKIQAIVVNYEIVVSHHERLVAWSPDCLILDEAHRCKEEGTSWTKTILAGKKEGKGKSAQVVVPGLAPAVRAQGGSVLVATGTPMPSGPWELVTLLQIAGRLDDFGGKTRFLRRYCGARMVEVAQGRRAWQFERDPAKQHLGELHVLLRLNGMIRRRLKDVRPDLELLPPEIVAVDADPAVMAEYRQAEADVAGYLAQRAGELARQIGKDPRSAAVRARIKAKMAEDAVELAVLRRLCGMAKVPAACAQVNDFFETHSTASMSVFDGDTGAFPPKLVVFGWHNDVLDALSERLGGVSLRSGQTRRQQTAARESFQNDPDVRLIVCSMGAASEGIELTAAQTCLTVEWDWVPKTHRQSVSRLYRRGQTAPVAQRFLAVEGSIDMVMQKVVGDKAFSSDAAIDGKPIDPNGSTMSVEDQVVDALVAAGLAT